MYILKAIDRNGQTNKPVYFAGPSKGLTYTSAEAHKFDDFDKAESVAFEVSKTYGARKLTFSALYQ